MESWQSEAACLGVPMDEITTTMCYAKCAVRAECAALYGNLVEQLAGLDVHLDGVWGGQRILDARAQRKADRFALCPCGEPVERWKAQRCLRCYERERAREKLKDPEWRARRNAQRKAREAAKREAA